MQILHQLLKFDLLPDPCATLKCPSCTENTHPDDIDILHSISLIDTAELLQSDSERKHKTIYIARYNTKQANFQQDSDECISSKYLNELNRGGLTLPTISTVFFSFRLACTLMTQLHLQDYVVGVI